MTLKIADNDNNIKDEIENGKFNLDLSDHILHLKSFIDKDICKICASRRCKIFREFSKYISSM